MVIPIKILKNREITIRNLLNPHLKMHFSKKLGNQSLTVRIFLFAKNIHFEFRIETQSSLSGFAVELYFIAAQKFPFFGVPLKQRMSSIKQQIISPWS